MKSAVSFEIAGSKLFLHPSKALYIESCKTLVISDLHIGKSEHFRKNGILIPRLTNKNNFWKLVEVIDEFCPENILFLGDIAHSQYNREWEEFVDVLDQFPTIQKSLAIGNHDILHPEEYQRANIKTASSFILDNILWLHEPPQEMSSTYTMVGHIHPSVKLAGAGRQSLRLPCFYFGEKMGILPAFGEFTGSFTLKPKKNDHIYVVTENKIIKVQ